MTHEVRVRLTDEVDRVRPDAERVARTLFDQPELAYEETASVALLRAEFDRLGFRVGDVAGMPTAFVASSGAGATTVAVCLEYDALPDIGQACGHHLIAGAGLLTAAALASVAGELGITVLAIGCPAEEHGGGKINLLGAGVFEGVDLAVMVHFVPDGIRADPAGTSSQAVGRFRATFTGRESHAAAAPWLGVNATDAITVSQVALAVLRQQVPPDHRLSANVVRTGSATNIIPGHGMVEYECRAWTLPEFEVLLQRVSACFEAGALATGCTVEIVPVEHTFEPLTQDARLAAAWSAELRALDIDPRAGEPMAGGSTDMGNVSNVVPALHPWFSLPGVTAPIHSPGFAEGASRPAAYERMRNAAVALAGTVAAYVLGEV